MSTILKALKKLEERKASEGQRSGDIAWDILREEQRSAQLEIRWKLWFGGAAGLLSVLLLVLWSLYPRTEPGKSLNGVQPDAVVSGPLREATPEQPQRMPETMKRPRPVSAAQTEVRSELVAVPSDLHLSVTGIAFQADAEARMALVNDLPVMVGTVIEGVVVERIEERQVIFSRLGRRFAVSLSAPD